MCLTLKDVRFTYLPGTPMAREVLRGVDLEVREGEVLCLMGRTGAGKSTLLQVASGLLAPSGGRILLDGRRTDSSRRPRQALRGAVGALLQSPSSQLFAETVERDVSFGLRDLSLSPSETRARAHEALRLVGLDPAAYAGLSPFALSEGEMRRVALAGVLVTRPRFLLLDEPFSGLDGQGREGLATILSSLRREGTGILMATHDWEEVTQLADRVAVLTEGRIAMCGARDTVVADVEGLVRAGLRPPPLAEVFHELRARGFALPGVVLDAREAAQAIISCRQAAGGRER
ncbi:MAG: ATP-binding cassette domain-containing protein [Actinobacteria bacterium]|nr:ATP-binding cassette domain-containing protein [Actinomycetota bacterium]